MTSSRPVKLSRDVDAIEIPSGASKTLRSGSTVRLMQSRGGSHTVTAADTGAMYRIDEKHADALGLATPPPDPGPASGPLTDKLISDQLKTVFDPEIPINILELGLVYSCVSSPLKEGGNRIDVKMTLTAPGCGMSDVLKADVESKLSRLPTVKQVHVEVVFDPPWHPGLMSEAARLQLGFEPEADKEAPVFPIYRPKT